MDCPASTDADPLLLLHEHQYHPLAILDIHDETTDTRSFVLDIPATLRDTFHYTAGQFCTFRATVNGDEVVRCYSMSSSPDTGDPFTTTVKRVPTGRMSNWMNDTLTLGDTIDVLRPSGLFVLHPHDTPIVAFAGGSGITPVISIVKTALVTTGRPIRLVYANRDADSVIFREAIDRLIASNGDRLSVHHHLDSDGGFLDPDACAKLAGAQVDADFYICGPGPYMDTVEAGLATLGVEPTHVFIERFELSEDTGSESETSDTESIVIKLAKQEKSIDYQVGDTILETARRAGLNPPFSCEQGHCATCMAHLDAGTVRMRVNNALSPEEVTDGWVLTCQSLPTSREVVIDYDA